MADLDQLVAAARGASIRREVADGYVRELERWAPKHHQRSWWPIGLGIATLAAAAAAVAIILTPPKPAPVAVVAPVIQSQPAASAPVVDAPVVDAPVVTPPPPPPVHRPAHVDPPPPVQVPNVDGRGTADGSGAVGHRGLIDRWHEARLLRGQGRFADAVAACIAIADTNDTTWAPIALVEAIRIELGPLVAPEQALALADRMLRDWPSNALADETRALRCQAMQQLGRDCKPTPP